MRLRMLSIGNSFSVDSMKLMDRVAQSAGFTEICLGNLFVPGCSVNRHYTHLTGNIPAYEYYQNDGTGWVCTSGYRITDAVKERDWDWINIQHGSGDGSRYSTADAYVHLPEIIEAVRQMAPKAKICFNMTWVGDANKPRSEMPEYEDRLHELYLAIRDLTRELIVPMVDRVCPTGTAIENLRYMQSQPMTRDGYHLSYDLGRYTAAMSVLKSLTGCDIGKLSWAPETVTPEQKQLAIEAVENAIAAPFG